MNKDINKRLEELNVDIENASPPAGSYIPYVISNNLFSYQDNYLLLMEN